MCPALQIYEHPRPNITKDPFLAQTLKWFQLHPAIKWYIQKRTKKKKRKKKKRKHYEFLFLQDWTCMFRCKLLHSSIIKILGDICFIQPTKLQTSACFNQPTKLLFITKVAAFFCNSGYICFTWMFSANQIYI